MSKTTTKKRLYYTCPIRALYMAKEFGVKFECKNSDEEIKELDLSDDDIFYPFEESSLDQSDVLEDLIGEFNNFRKIYVLKESKSIFDPKKGDVITHTSEYIDDKSYTLRRGDIGSNWTNTYFDEINMRDNKNFFTPENEK